MSTNLMDKAVWGASLRPGYVKRVLIVEDDPDASEMLAAACRLEGYQAYLAGDGCQALRQLSAGVAPDLILLDLDMPVMDGWEFRSVQQHHREWADIPVVIISAEIAGGHRLDIAPLAELAKPLDVDALSAILRALPAH
jgi:DNA-binding response OmpR family regulator